MNETVLKYRQKIRKVLLDFLSMGATPKPGIHILNGHFLSLDTDKSSQVFSDLLDKLAEAGVSFTDFEYAVRQINSRRFPEDRCLVAFSWDDGFEECFTKIKPVLDSRAIRAAFFINPNFVDGDTEYRNHFTGKVVRVDKPPMSWEQIRILHSEGHTIGAHTLDHLSLNSNDIEFLTRQIVGCRERLAGELSDNIDHFAFPFGRLEHISAMGVETACNTYPFVYSQSNYRHYFSFDGKVINRRHFECDWPVRHVLYFLKSKVF